MTALAAALERAGFSKAEMEAFSAAIKFIQQGGKREQWIAVFDRAAERMCSKGHITADNNVHSDRANAAHEKAGKAKKTVSKDLGPYANPAPLIPGKGQAHVADNSLARVANAGKSITGADQACCVKNDHSTPVRASEPSKSFIDAKVRTFKLAARSVMDKTLASDGRPWSRIKYHEGFGAMRDGAIHKELHRIIGPLFGKKRDCTYAELVKPHEFEDAIARVNHANA